MKQITVRQVDERCLSEAKRIAATRGLSMNTVLVEALERGLGLTGGTRRNGLEKYAGDSDFGPEWEARMQAFDRIDPGDWK